LRSRWIWRHSVRVAGLVGRSGANTTLRHSKLPLFWIRG